MPATKPPTKQGFAVTCPHCHADEPTVSICLQSLECHCSECDETFTARQARDLAAAELRRWEAVCQWVALAGEVLDQIAGEAFEVP